MNLLHVIQRYYPYVGGSELYFAVLSEYFAARGDAVSVYTTDAFDLEHFWAPGKRTIDPTAPVEHHPRRRGEVERNFALARRAAEVLGFRAQVTLQDGVERTVEWFRAERRLWDASADATTRALT
jgi:nucleoside-diphosphate-sugar epimerase